MLGRKNIPTVKMAKVINAPMITVDIKSKSLHPLLPVKLCDTEPAATPSNPSARILKAIDVIGDRPLSTKLAVPPLETL